MSNDNSTDVDDDVYDVERILAEKTIDGSKHYLVKWSGYSDAECTWEPPQNFNNDNTLPDWEVLKASGDALEAADIALVEARMKIFQRHCKLTDGLGDMGASDDDEDDDQPLKDVLRKAKLVLSFHERG